jgi:4-hydroxy-3-methylbut-2-enyl diphosphate reductase
MKVIRARVLGFCMGVRRAVEIAKNSRSESRGGEAGQGRKAYTLGPLIHNPQVLKELEDLGFEILDGDDLPQNLEGAVVIIRAHGVSPRLEEDIKSRGGRIIDATCPKVKANQLKAAALSRAGYRLFLAGEARHAEIAGIRGFAPGCITAADRAGAEAAAEKLRLEENTARTALIGQSTISPEEYRFIGEGIKKYFPDLEIIDTICGAARDRQEALRELLDQVDAVVVAGGKGSANTLRLLAIAGAGGKPCVLAETAADIPASFAAYERVGLCAGASTPDAIIGGIEEALMGLRP